MRHWGITKGKKVGVVGLGGLGPHGVKFAHALGANVVVFTNLPQQEGRRRFAWGSGLKWLSPATPMR